MATLYVLQGPDKGRTIKIDDEALLIGRGSDQLPFTDQTVSRRHAELKPEGSAWLLRDLNSANGTYLNAPASRNRSSSSTAIRSKVGSTVMMYSGEDSIERFPATTFRPTWSRLKLMMNRHVPPWWRAYHPPKTAWSWPRPIRPLR